MNTILIAKTTMSVCVGVCETERQTRRERQFGVKVCVFTSAFIGHGCRPDAHWWGGLLGGLTVQPTHLCVRVFAIM